MKAIIALLSALLLMNPLSENPTHKSIEKGAQDSPLVSFGIIADVQYCECPPAGSRFYRNSLTKLLEAYSVFKADTTDFVINLGDLIDRDYSSFDPVMKIIGDSGIQTYHATGNHDYEVKPVLKKRIPQLKNEKTGYYSFVRNGFRFIVLNGNEVSLYGTNSKRVTREASSILARMADEGAVNAMEWNGAMSKNQLDWFDAQLTDAGFKNEKAILFCHFPVFPDDKHNLLNSKEVMDVLDKHHNVIAWFSGHNHSGNYGNRNMTHFITMRGMVETEGKNSFAKIEIYTNKIWITGYGNEKSMILAY